MLGKGRSREQEPADDHCFNEARAVCSGKATEGAYDRSPDDEASMRPERCARERAACRRPMRRRTSSFNEARAVCSGKAYIEQLGFELLAGFNEARAVCSGKAPLDPLDPPMNCCFNEARAVCSGKGRSVGQ